MTSSAPSPSSGSPSSVVTVALAAALLLALAAACESGPLHGGDPLSRGETGDAAEEAALAAQPPGEEGACTHTFGGAYADRGCTASYQCCDGRWQRGPGTCGACACTEPSGMEGCAPAPAPAACVPDDEAGRCTHSFGGTYADGACSASYQCCGGQWRQGHGACGACVCVEGSGEIGCGVAASCGPAFQGTSRPLPPAVRAQMTGRSWREGCPVGLDALALLEMSHWGMDGEVHTGRMVVAASVADEVLEAFRRLFDARFPIEQMRLVDEYEASDDLSMAANNTSAFNCRRVTGGTAYSHHSYGTAIDINPIQNPYVRGTVVLPPSGAAYVDRSLDEPGMIRAGDAVTDAFADLGWTWGGDYGSLKDWQHFSKSGG